MQQGDHLVNWFVGEIRLPENIEKPSHIFPIFQKLDLRFYEISLWSEWLEKHTAQIFKMVGVKFRCIFLSIKLLDKNFE